MMVNNGIQAAFHTNQAITSSSTQMIAAQVTRL